MLVEESSSEVIIEKKDAANKRQNSLTLKLFQLFVSPSSSISEVKGAPRLMASERKELLFVDIEQVSNFRMR